MVAFWGVPFGSGAAFVFGGTSAGSPQWSGLVALADQAIGDRVGLINPVLYALSHNPSTYHSMFHDITVGNNNFDTMPGTITGYNASAGWDPVTGLGTPQADKLIGPLTGQFEH